MIQSLMLGGIGLFAGCLLMLAFLPVVHRRALRIAKRRLVEATPLAVSEIQAERDQLRAQFAVSVRRLEIGLEQMRAKVVTRHRQLYRDNAEITRLQLELDKKNALIVALRAREEVRKSLVRRLAKLVLYCFVRSRRGRQPPRLRLEQSAPWEFDEQAEQKPHVAAAAALAVRSMKRRQPISNEL